MFKLVPDALPEATIAWAKPFLDELVGRCGGKSSLTTNDASAEARAKFLEIADGCLFGPVRDLFVERHGVEPAICLSLTTLRQQLPGSADRLVNWHLDLNFINDDKPFLVAWTPMEEVGETRVAIEVCVPTGSGYDLKPLVADWYRRKLDKRTLTFSDSELDELIGAGNWAARAVKARPGMAAVFDQYVLHRSQLLEGATDSRMSIEFRLVDLDNLPMSLKHQNSIFLRRNPEGGTTLFSARRGKAETLKKSQFGTIKFK